MELPGGAAATIDRFLDACDQAVPGLVVGLHVVGSLVLGDYRSDRSDIDVVVVVRTPPDRVQSSLLAGVHRVVAAHIDGPYLTELQLAGAPLDLGPVAHHVDGRFEVVRCHEVSPVTWAILAYDAITVRGRSPAELGLRSDPSSVQAFSAANLRDYWSNWATTIAALIAATDDDETIEAGLLEWGVLGSARVDCAATTGRVVSKRAGGEYVRSRVGPEWHALIDLALDIRAGRIDEVEVADLRAACTFVHMLADADADADADPGEVGEAGEVDTGPARGWNG